MNARITVTYNIDDRSLDNLLRMLDFDKRPEDYTKEEIEDVLSNISFYTLYDYSKTESVFVEVEE